MSNSNSKTTNSGQNSQSEKEIPRRFFRLYSEYMAELFPDVGDPALWGLMDVWSMPATAHLHGIFWISEHDFYRRESLVPPDRVPEVIEAMRANPGILWHEPSGVLVIPAVLRDWERVTTKHVKGLLVFLQKIILKSPKNDRQLAFKTAIQYRIRGYLTDVQKTDRPGRYAGPLQLLEQARDPITYGSLYILPEYIQPEYKVLGTRYELKEEADSFFSKVEPEPEPEAPNPEAEKMARKAVGYFKEKGIDFAVGESFPARVAAILGQGYSEKEIDAVIQHRVRQPWIQPGYHSVASCIAKPEEFETNLAKAKAAGFRSDGIQNF